MSELGNEFSRQWPHLAHFCLEEKIKRPQYRQTHKWLCFADMIAEGVPPESCNAYSERCNLLEACLGVGYRDCGLTQDRRSRLAGGDHANLMGVLNELRVAAWFESQGFVVDFDPPAKGGGRGDLLVRYGSEVVFVEVKTVFGDADLLNQEDFLADFADHLETEAITVRSVELVRYPSNIDRKQAQRIAADLLDYVRVRIPTRGAMEDQAIRLQEEWTGCDCGGFALR